MDDTTPVVNQPEVTVPDASEGAKTQTGVPVIGETETQPAPKVGDRTDPNLLLKSLREEREKRREAEERIKELETSTLSDEEFSEEGKALRGEINVLKSELSEVKSELTKKDVLIAHPILKEKWDSFEEFRELPDNKGMNLRTAAKAFLVENGLLDVPRKGLEKTTGGPRVPVSSGMTTQDVEMLRKTNFKKYQELLRAGQLKIEG